VERRRDPHGEERFFAAFAEDAIFVFARSACDEAIQFAYAELRIASSQVLLAMT